MSYVKLFDIATKLGIKRGDKVFVSSAIRDLVHIARENEKKPDLNDLIDGFIQAIGPEGTLIFPTYNWDWCRGIDFDYMTTPSKVGALSQIALERKDFKRTRHPIYSFAVWGKDQSYLCSLDDRSSFGKESPFKYFMDNCVINVVINVELKNSFTFVHYVEESLMDKVKYRYMKNFRGKYTDERGETSYQTYSMLVKSYWYDVEEEVDLFEEEFLSSGAERIEYINGIKFGVIALEATYPIIEKDILENESKRLCIGTWQNKEISLKEYIYGLVKEMYPLCSSITGEGLRNRLNIIKPELFMKALSS